MKLQFSFLLCIGMLSTSSPGLAQAPVHDIRSTKELVEFHRNLRPGLGVQDVLKMLYQANLGVEHLLTDTTGVRAFLVRELGTLDPPEMHESLVEPISTRGNLVRVNLRPFKDLNLGPDLLVQMMFESAAETKPDTLMFYRQWNEFFDLVRYGFLKFPMEDAERWHGIVTDGPPKPVHHTGRYKDLYKPAYPVVQKAVFDRMMTRGNE